MITMKISTPNLDKKHEIFQNNPESAADSTLPFIELGKGKIHEKVIGTLLEINPDIPENITKKLTLDYQECQEILNFNELLDEDGQSYTGDYVNPNDESEDFRDIKFEMPTIKEVLSWITPEQFEVYEQMERDGLEPKLQLTPIAYDLSTFGNKFDKHKRTNTERRSFICSINKKNEFIYDPEGYETESFIKVKAIGGKNKAEWIEENEGWLVEIIATKQIIEPDRDIENAKDSQGIWLKICNGVKRYFDKLKEKGLSGLCCESYIMAQMRAEYEGKPLDNGKYYTVFPSILFKSKDRISIGYWDDMNLLRLFTLHFSQSCDLASCRPSMKIVRR
ncbi:hypothetical protein ACFL21_04480 [Patescibacteria group bacterium]